jgi:diaminopimelate epimerase
MHGCGNDFLVVDGPLELDAERVRRLCDRRRGIGADGILVIGAPTPSGAPTPAAADERRWAVTLHNADGSLGESCGNGARCVGRYLLDRQGGESVVLAFAGGDVTARRDDGGIAISLAAPSLPEPVDLGGQRGYRVRVGNPHVVVFVADPSAIDLTKLAASVRQMCGPANVEVARVLEPALITLRVDERGVGETLACGTGACATVAAAGCEHTIEGTVRVRVLGGELVVRQGQSTYELVGPAEYVFEGALP